jgi:hypothetical protein
VSKHAAYVPKHRAAPRRNRVGPRVVRGAVVMSGLAVAATGMSVSSGVLASSPVGDGTGDLADAVQAAGGTNGEAAAAEVEGRDAEVSRSGRRADSQVQSRAAKRGQDQTQEQQDLALAAKAAVLGTDQGLAMAATEDLSDDDPREIGRALLAEYGFAADQFECLDALYVSESNWRVDADNPTSSAYGIPQALTSLHDLPADYMTSAEAQIRWGLDYIDRAYGTPCNAWAFKQGHGWY